MFLYFIWYAGILLNLIILCRGVATRLYLRFPIFYTYSTVVFVSSVWGLIDYQLGQKPYWYAFWTWEIISIVLGYGVVLEITHLAFKDYPGAAKRASEGPDGELVAVAAPTGLSSGPKAASVLRGAGGAPAPAPKPGARPQRPRRR